MDAIWIPLIVSLHLGGLDKNIENTRRIETHAWNIENRPYKFFFKLFYEDILW